MKEQTKIFLRDLQGNGEKPLDFFLDFSACSEEAFLFETPVHVHGCCYLAEETLILHIHVDVHVKVVCKICNEKFTQSYKILDTYITEDVENISHGVYNPFDEIRDLIFVHIPSYPECNHGHCPSRESLKKYLQSSHDV